MLVAWSINTVLSIDKYTLRYGNTYQYLYTLPLFSKRWNSQYLQYLGRGWSPLRFTAYTYRFWVRGFPDFLIWHLYVQVCVASRLPLGH